MKRLVHTSCFSLVRTGPIDITKIINEQLHLHKFHIKTIKITPTCFDLFWIIIRELCFSLLKLYYKYFHCYTVHVVELLNQYTN